MHITKYGNRYTDQEWAKMQAYFAEEEANNDAISAKIAGLIKYLTRQLKKVGLNPDQRYIVICLFRYGDYEEANIHFTSEDRKTKLDDLWKRWNVAMSGVYDDAMEFEDNLEIKRLEIMEKE